MCESNRISLETDYLVIGAGATALAFVDEFVNTNANIRFIIIDKHAKPGGHWNDAYEFVTLHQPADFYGVNSRQLGDGGNDLVSAAQIIAYYELVMKDLLATGRVEFYPQCEYSGDDVFTSLMEVNLEYKVKVLKKRVDAKYIFSEVPSITKPEFKISNGVNFMPINGLSGIRSPWKKYVIIGGGKTGIDAVLFLLEQNVDPNNITWIVPNDMWMLLRPNFYGNSIVNTFLTIFECLMLSDNYEEFYEHLESKGIVIRLDTNIKPTRMKGSTATVQEVEQLRRITNIVRRGRIECIEPSRILFKNGSQLSTDTDTLHVDCSAYGERRPPKRKIFDGNTIFLQVIEDFQPLYSAAVIAAYENTFPDDDERKNELCKPLPQIIFPHEYISLIKETLINDDGIGKVLGVWWIRKTRLNILYRASFHEFLRLMIYMKWYESSIIESINKIIKNIGEEKGT